MPIYSTYRCSNCKNLFYVQTWKSNGHISPIRIKSKRSDGKVITSSRPYPSSLVSCPTCEEPFTLKDSAPESRIEIEPLKTKAALKEFINSVDHDESGKQNNEPLSWDRLPKELAQMPSYIPLTYRACLKILKDLGPDEKQRFKYLHKAWNLLNDMKENDPSFKLKAADKMILESLLTEKSNHYDASFLRMAELYRELSQFDEAAAILNRDFDFESGAEAEQLMLAIEAKNSALFYFELDNTDDLSYAWQMRRFKPETPTDHENDSEMNPPCFKISNRDWWVKVLGMLQHNWALIEEDRNGATTVYFFHDGGMTLGSTGYRLSEIRSRCAVVDSLNFPDREDASQALDRNGFFRLTERPGPWMNDYPKGHFYDARATEEGIYSRGEYWI